MSQREHIPNAVLYGNLPKVSDKITSKYSRGTRQLHWLVS